MSKTEYVFLAFYLLGGMTLFLVGMKMMTHGLCAAAGASLRTVLAVTTRNAPTGLGLGTVLGFLAHSGPAMVMVMGFVNAGLITLPQCIPPMIGLNVGTTLSMQMISFHLTDYCFMFMTVGFILQIAAPASWLKNSGQALLGFGMLFLGMKTIGDAVHPHRELLAQLLLHIHGDNLTGMLVGIALSTLLTVAVQSSGAVIGACFVLAEAGVFTQLSQVYPIVLGAHIGTCSTVLIASVGTNIDARRSALAHLLFNVVGVVIGVAAAPWIIAGLVRTTPGMLHQTANLHTAIMVLAAVVILPVYKLYARLIVRIFPSRQPAPQPSFLDTGLLAYPERALQAAIQELQRVTRVCTNSMWLNIQIIFNEKRKDIQRIRLNEDIVDEIKRAMKEYLKKLASHYLSRRQAMLAQHLNRCITDLERIGDHIDELCDITLKRHRHPQGRLPKESLTILIDLIEAAAIVLHLVSKSLKPELQQQQEQAQEILAVRDAYMQKSQEAKNYFMDVIGRHELPPIVGVYMSEYISALDRIVKHGKIIALVEKQPDFWIKAKKLNDTARDVDNYVLPEKVDPNDFLSRLHAEYYL